MACKLPKTADSPPVNLWGERTFALTPIADPQQDAVANDRDADHT